MHGVDVEGKQLGVDEALVRLLGAASPLPVTYAGGVRTLVGAPPVGPCVQQSHPRSMSSACQNSLLPFVEHPESTHSNPPVCTYFSHNYGRLKPNPMRDVDCAL